MKNLNFEVNTRCPFCGKETTILVNIVDYWEWVNEGKLAQEAFSYLTTEEREMVISGTCPDCWERMFGFEEEDEEEEDEDYYEDVDECGFNPYMGCYDFDC